MSRKSEPEHPLKLPIDLDPVSNGEYLPIPKSETIRRVQEHAWERVAENAKRLGVSRRAFLRTSCGAATVLASMNTLLGCGGGGANTRRRGEPAGGNFAVPPEAELDEAAAREAVGGDDFIFDVQTHRVATDRDWYERNEVFRNLARSRGACGDGWIDCYTTDNYVKEVFLDSDTQMAVLSAVPGGDGELPLMAREAAETRETVQRMDGTGRVLIHGIIQPEVFPMEQVLEQMEQLHEQWDVDGWKVYTVWGPDGTGWWLDDEDTGIRLIEKARELGVKTIAAHKGLPQPGMQPRYTRPRDVGPVASAYSDVKFLIYHSGFETDKREGPYDPSAERGVDAFIRTLEEHDIGPDGNVYAEMGVLWRVLREKPEQAAHTMGKLMKHLGEDRILWGTDSIWFGSPQDQIQSFHAFEIDEQLQEQHGYPALTPERKAKIFGLNATAAYDVDVAAVRSAHTEFDRARALYRADPQPSFTSYGPRTRRELFSLK